jgi:signal transduction histidine kinase
VRVLVRFHDPGGDALPPRAAGVVEGSLELMIAELVVRAQGGTLSLASTEGEETVIVIDLPAP